MVNKSKQNKIFVIVGVAILAAILGTIAFQSFSDSPAPKTDQQIIKQAEKNSPKPDPKNDTEQALRSQSPLTTTPASPGSPRTVLNPVITTLEQSGSTIILDATVGSATTGTCTATFTQGSVAPISKSNPVTLVTSYYACGEFQIPTSEFSPLGVWSAQVTFDSTQYHGTSDQQAITVQ